MPDPIKLPPGLCTRTFGRTDLSNGGERIINYLMSDTAVARDNHRIFDWTVNNYLSNPVFLWAHSTSQPPIGRVVDLQNVNGVLRGSVRYAGPDEYEFADTIYKLARGGYLNAVSVSWNPLKWKFATDRNRPGGIDFELVDLLEVSQVPVPAHPQALATARAHGIDTQPIYEWATQVLDEGGMMLVPRDELELLRREAKMPQPTAHRASSDWKCGASRNLPVDEESAWDGAAAKQSIFDKAGFDGDNPDVTFARKGFLLYDAANPKEKGSYSEPFATVKDGRLTAVAAGIRNAASRLPQVTDVPDSAKEEARAVIDHYESKMNGGKSSDEKREAKAAKIEALKRDMCQVSWLAAILGDLDFLEDMVEWEAAIEEDGSPIPAQIAAIKQQLGEVLIAMVGEEVAEMNAEEGGERSMRLAAIDCVVRLDDGARQAIVAAMRAHIAGRKVTFTEDGNPETRSLGRAGKVLSSANEKTLRDAHGMIMQAADMVHGVVNQNGDASDDDGGEAARAAIAAKAVRERKAKALKRKLSVVS